MDKVDAIVDKLNDAWKNAGLEFHPFKVAGLHFFCLLLFLLA